MADQTDLGALVARLRAASQAMARLEPEVQARETWPLSDNIGIEPEAHWGPPETLAHVAEMVPFWTGEIERVLAGPSEPVPFGRVASNPLRIGIIERDRSLPPRELFGRIEATAERLAVRLAELGPAEAARLGVHPTLGDLSVAQIVETFVVAHLEDHVEQVRHGLGEA